MIRDIVIWPDSVLAKKAEVVTDFSPTSPIHEFARDMEQTMLAARGAGLAAPQLGFLLRMITVVVARVDGKGQELATLINPVIVESKGQQMGMEGCLSLPGYFEQVKRAMWVKIEAQDLDGSRIEVEGDGFLARALQHEIEHLDGHVFVDHVSVLKRNRAAAKFKKAKAKGMRYTLADRPTPQDFTLGAG